VIFGRVRSFGARMSELFIFHQVLVIFGFHPFSSACCLRLFCVSGYGDG
jgi:hypothetical protein